MRLSDALEQKKLDTRLVDKHISEGKLRKEDLVKHLSGLPNDEDNARYLEIKRKGGHYSVQD